MAVYLLPEFIVDLQDHRNPNFAKRVLQKLFLPNGGFRSSADDHRYRGIDGAWIRYVSQGKSAFRVVYLREGGDIYLYRAGEHGVEERLVSPSFPPKDNTIQVSTESIGLMKDAADERYAGVDLSAIIDREGGFLRNIPKPEIYQKILSRRNLPHKDIWLIAPFVTPCLFSPTAVFGKLLLDQVEDGANVLIVTAMPSNHDIYWMEVLAERGVEVYLYPKLHAKLYCFLLDDIKCMDSGLDDVRKYRSLCLIGSANLTAKGMAINTSEFNEELCFSLPSGYSDEVEKYVIELVTRGYDLTSARCLIATGKSDVLKKNRW